MERLTKKSRPWIGENDWDYDSQHKISGTIDERYYPWIKAELDKCLDKLGKLEDIEEELGVDLIKLLTADKIYYKAHGEIESNIFDVSFYSFLILVRVYHSPYRKDDEHFAFGFNDYGKTWAFTRKELEYDN